MSGTDLADNVRPLDQDSLDVYFGPPDPRKQVPNPISFRTCYAKSGTALAHRATMSATGCPVLTECVVLPAPVCTAAAP
eukprot:3913831-Rhodomonas_salina.2